MSVSNDETIRIHLKRASSNVDMEIKNLRDDIAAAIPLTDVGISTGDVTFTASLLTDPGQSLLTLANLEVGVTYEIELSILVGGFGVTNTYASCEVAFKDNFDNANLFTEALVIPDAQFNTNSIYYVFNYTAKAITFTIDIYAEVAETLTIATGNAVATARL